MAETPPKSSAAQAPGSSGRGCTSTHPFPPHCHPRGFIAPPPPPRCSLVCADPSSHVPDPTSALLFAVWPTSCSGFVCEEKTVWFRGRRVGLDTCLGTVVTQ